MSRNIPRGSESQLSFDDIQEGNEMVNFHEEFGHSRFYTRNAFNTLIRPGTPMRNPFTREPILNTNIRYYRAHLVDPAPPVAAPPAPAAPSANAGSVTAGAVAVPIPSHIAIAGVTGVTNTGAYIVNQIMIPFDETIWNEGGFQISTAFTGGISIAPADSDPYKMIINGVRYNIIHVGPVTKTFFNNFLLETYGYNLPDYDYRGNPISENLYGMFLMNESLATPVASAATGGAATGGAATGGAATGGSGTGLAAPAPAPAPTPAHISASAGAATGGAAATSVAPRPHPRYPDPPSHVFMLVKIGQSTNGKDLVNLYIIPMNEIVKDNLIYQTRPTYFKSIGYDLRSRRAMIDGENYNVMDHFTTDKSRIMAELFPFGIYYLPDTDYRGNPIQETLIWITLANATLPTAERGAFARHLIRRRKNTRRNRK